MSQNIWIKKHIGSCPKPLDKILLNIDKNY